jgi:hypothetical protein
MNEVGPGLRGRGQAGLIMEFIGVVVAQHISQVELLPRLMGDSVEDEDGSRYAKCFVAVSVLTCHKEWNTRRRATEQARNQIIILSLTLLFVPFSCQSLNASNPLYLFYQVSLEAWDWDPPAKCS